MVTTITKANAAAEVDKVCDGAVRVGPVKGLWGGKQGQEPGMTEVEGSEETGGELQKICAKKVGENFEGGRYLWAYI